MNDAPAARSIVVMAVYQMYNDLHDFEVQYGATVSGLTNSQIETLLETRPKRINLNGQHHSSKILKLYVY